MIDIRHVRVRSLTAGRVPRAPTPIAALVGGLLVASAPPASAAPPPTA
ncbi:hypothetical protein K7G98_05500 [Saccharothrix sp. MB29]|nr:hypothetical protein [Saccharothrix sp. MB29]